MKVFRRLCCILLAAFLAAPVLARAEDLAPRPWVIDGKPINPVCLLPIGDLTGQSDIVDLTDCGSNLVVMDGHFNRPDLIGFSYKEKGETSDWGVASFYYRYVGTVEGKDIVYALYSGGVTGLFESLVALKRQTATVFEMTALANGSRCSGGVSNAVVKNGQLRFDQSLTPWGLMQFGLTPYDNSFHGLDDVSCIATAHMRPMDLTMLEEKFSSITLSGSLFFPNKSDGELLLHSPQPQGCFYTVYQNFIDRQESEIDASKLRAFRKQFKDCIARN